VVTRLPAISATAVRPLREKRVGNRRTDRSGSSSTVCGSVRFTHIGDHEPFVITDRACALGRAEGATVPVRPFGRFGAILAALSRITP
jgi:hypothetical protein